MPWLYYLGIKFKEGVTMSKRNENASNRQVGKLENWLYAFSGFGVNVFFGMPMMFMLIYYTDVFGISASVIGTLFLVARLWDAVNDPMMGGFVDKTKSRLGKCRPYLIFGPVALGIIFVLMFSGPQGLSGTGKIIFAYVTYILYGMAYTLVDIPGHALVSRMTSENTEKTKVMTLRRVVANFGMLIGAGAVMPLVGLLGRGNANRGYLMTAAVFAVIAGVPIILSGLTAKERVVETQDHQKFEFKELYSILKSNVPLLITVMVFIVNQIAMSIKTAAMAYYFTYNIGRVELIAVVSGISLIFTILGTALIPLITRKMGKKNGMILAMAIIGATSLGLALTPATSVGLILGWFILNSLAAGFGLAMPFIIAMDAVEYGEWKTGKRTEGIIFSLMTFGTKLASAIGGAMLGYILTWTGYVANQTQTSMALNGILFSMAIFPILVSIIGIVLMKFYNLSDEKLQTIAAELMERKKSVA